MKSFFPENTEPRRIKISIPSMMQKFHPCTEEYIKTVCKGRCCEGSKGIKVVVEDSEIDHIRALGASVEDNFILADDRKLCPFKSDEGFCKIHEQKPFGCKASPFILSKNDVLIVRNRYRLLRCFNAVGAIEAYKAHRWSLEQIFGCTEYEKLCNGIKRGGKDVYLLMEHSKYLIFKHNTQSRKHAN